MKLLADENKSRSMVVGRRDTGNSVISVAEDSPGIPDNMVLELANQNGAILVTEDKDFGELAYRQKLVHFGIILIRLPRLSPAEKCRMLEIVLDRHERDLKNSFTVITPTQIRIRKAD
jgi:predicted nuclease of predicted toxin-antitoxin system